MASLDRNSVKIHYEVHGSGPAILLTHGYSSTAAMWRGQIGPLSKQHTLILWDMRGHGQSDYPEDQAQYSEEHTVADMAAILDAVGAKQAVIGGLSLGGYMSLGFYREHPERTEALLIIDTGPGFKKDEARAGWNATAEKTAQRYASDGLGPLESATAERRTARHRNARGLELAARGMLAQRDARVINSLPDIKVPSLVIVGANDTPFIAASDYMAAKIPGAKKVVIPDAGHAANIDQPELFNHAVLDFLESIAMTDTPDWNPATIAAQGLGWIDEKTRGVSPPIHVSSTFERDADNQYRSGRNYARPDNPTFDQPEAVLTALEKGAGAMLFSSGMAAATACFLALRPGDHIVASKVMYWSLRNWIVNFARDWGLQVDIVDMSDLDALKRAMRPGKTKLVWAETPSNPLWEITDLAAAADIAHGTGARLAVDSTCATPVLSQPLSLGADIVMHSATKYLNGHSDLVMGALVARADDEYWARLTMIRAQNGGIPGAFESWLLLRGMRTLYPRVRAACANAQAVAEHFSKRPRLEAVLYPGLKNSPGHAIAAKQMTGGFGGMLSIRVKGGEAAAIACAGRVKVWKRATSLGGTESLIEHRASVEGTGSPCPPDLLRLSAGIEDAADLIADLEQALGGNT